MSLHTALRKRQDEIEIEIIATLLTRLQKTHAALLTTTALRNTTKVVRRRVATEGLSFLTKTLPKLAKAFDKAIAGEQALDAVKLRWEALPNSKLPRFLGELFSAVLDSNGVLLPGAHADVVRSIRQLLLVFYKYELPYAKDQEADVLAKFERTEQDINISDGKLDLLETQLNCAETEQNSDVLLTKSIRSVLERVFSDFDFEDITPRHGPGAVATKQKLWDKYRWDYVDDRLDQVYPFTLYFRAGIGHALDTVDAVDKLPRLNPPAQVILVSKDSRGPRVISCEPVAKQWIQQGIMRRLIQHVENHPLTRHGVYFTNQRVNQIGALCGSQSGRYATLDLNEASDRISLKVVRLLFPSRVLPYLEATRSDATRLPDKRIIKLNKFAPMGSALCFPVLGITCWAILYCGAPDRYTRERIAVYGDRKSVV